MNRASLITYVIHACGGCVCLAILALGYFVGYAPQLGDSRKIAEQEQQVNALSASAPRVRAKNMEMQKECRALAEEIAALRGGIPSSPREHELLSTFSQLAKLSSTQLLDFQPAQGPVENGLGVTILQMGFQGDYPSICQLLWGLDELQRVLRINSMSLRLIERESGTFEVSVELQAFHRVAQVEELLTDDAS